MQALLLPNEILSLSAEAVDRLLKASNPDAALLYLALMRCGNQLQAARRALNWTDSRAAAAFQELSKLSLVQGDVAQVAQPELSDKPPVYQRSDLLNSLQNDSNFHALYLEMEKALGKKLSDTDLQSLYTLYDFLALPAEVIFLLTKWCSVQCEEKYGPGRPPRMPMVKREGFRWKRLGVDTLPAAEEFLSKQTMLQGREREIMPLLGLGERLPVDRERDYIAGWVDMGFDNETIRLAYEKTLFRKGAMNWAYMNSILKNWHGSGFHTVAQVEAGDHPPVQRNQPAGQPPSSPAKTNRRPPASPKDYQPSQERIQKNADWLDEFLAQQERQKKEE